LDKVKMITLLQKQYMPMNPSVWKSWVARPSYTLSYDSEGDTHVALRAENVPNNSDGNSENS
jgi:hypothetical protein